MTTAIYAGSFDPFHVGHLEIINKSLKTFRNTVVLVAGNPYKTRMFSIEHSKDIIEAVVRCEVDSLPPDELTSEYCLRKWVSPVLVRGLRRGVTEVGMATERILRMFNEKKGLETVFFQGDSEISSTLIRSHIDAELDLTGIPEPGDIRALEHFMGKKAR